ncbi:MAG: type II toxin-antitoxin system VapC family toxin [Cellulomonas sp.]|nr:type II toxin-antitoxin system VapC family toxin [Cellulomonas sp.]
MIVVDTNVWSETLRPAPAPAVVAWLTEHASQVRMPVTTVHELRYGVELLASGRRRADLSAQIDQMLAAMPVLDYDAAAAVEHAVLRAQARAAGREPSAEDGQIAAIARLHGGAVATRNTADFAHLGVALVNPWT